MSWSAVSDAVAAALLVLGALLTLTAAIGIVRFPDVLTRMHSATKPQVLGLLAVIAGLGLPADASAYVCGPPTSSSTSSPTCCPLARRPKAPRRTWPRTNIRRTERLRPHRSER